MVSQGSSFRTDTSEHLNIPLVSNHLHTDQKISKLKHTSPCQKKYKPFWPFAHSDLCGGVRLKVFSQVWVEHCLEPWIKSKLPKVIAGPSRSSSLNAHTTLHHSIAPQFPERSDHSLKFSSRQFFRKQFVLTLHQKGLHSLLEASYRTEHSQQTNQVREVQDEIHALHHSHCKTGGGGQDDLYRSWGMHIYTYPSLQFFRIFSNSHPPSTIHMSSFLAFWPLQEHLAKFW